MERKTLDKPSATKDIGLDALHRLTHRAICEELRDFDWMNLDRETARKLHALLPCER
jgi:hypothetical protein